LYLPEKDFLTYLGLASRFYSNRDLNCNYAHRGSCFFDAPCAAVQSEYTKTDLFLSVGDNDQGIAYTMQVDFDKLLITGDKLGKSHTECYIGIFKSTEI
jgi:hypothetical protein